MAIGRFSTIFSLVFWDHERLLHGRLRRYRQLNKLIIMCPSAGQGQPKETGGRGEAERAR